MGAGLHDHKGVKTENVKTPCQPKDPSDCPFDVISSFQRQKNFSYCKKKKPCKIATLATKWYQPNPH